MTSLLLNGLVDPSIVKGVELGIEAVGKQVDLADLVIHLSAGNVATAQTEILPDGSLDMIISEAYERAVTDPSQPHPNRPEATAMHEILHRWINRENPAFEANVSQVRIGATNTFELYFNGPDGPAPIDQWGHLLGNAYIGDVMSGSYPTFRDRPQVLSATDLAMVKAGGGHVWTHAEQLVNTVYHEVLHRAPDSGGMAYWTGVLESGAVGEWDVWKAVIGGAQGADAQAVEVVGISHG